VRFLGTAARRATLTAILYASSALCAARDGAGEAMGFVVAAREKAEALDARGVLRSLKLSDPLYKEDTVRTDEGGRLQIAFTGGVIVAVGGNAEWTILGYAPEGNASTGKLAGHLRKGGIRVAAGALAGALSVEFRTGSSTGLIGVHGSGYACRALGHGMKVVRLAGERVTVSTAAGTVVLDRPSLGTTVAAPDAAPGRPTPLDPTELAELAFAVSSGAVGAAPSDGGELRKEARECARWGYWDLAADGASSSPGPAAAWAANEGLAALGQLADRTRAMRLLTGPIGHGASISPGTGAVGGCPT